MSSSSTTERLRQMAGACLLVVSAIALVIVYLVPRLDRASVASEDSTFRLYQSTQLETAGSFHFRIAHLDISYPSQMCENETLPVEARYHVEVVEVPNSAIPPTGLPPFRETRDTLKATVKAHLESSGFDSAPAEAYQHKRGVALPLNFTWTITPKLEGTHFLLLTLHEANIQGAFPGGDSVFAEATINGQTVQPEEGGTYKLPVTVTTYWGISQFWVSVITVVAGFIGAALCWDVATAYIKRRLGLEDSGAGAQESKAEK